MKKHTLLSILILIGATYDEACLAFEFVDYKIEMVDLEYIFLLIQNEKTPPDFDLYNSFLDAHGVKRLGEKQRKK